MKERRYAMITKEQADRIEAKLDRILNTFGIREAISSESRQKIATITSMSLDDLKAYSKQVSRELRRGKR